VPGYAKKLSRRRKEWKMRNGGGISVSSKPITHSNRRNVMGVKGGAAILNNGFQRGTWWGRLGEGLKNSKGRVRGGTKLL